MVDRRLRELGSGKGSICWVGLVSAGGKSKSDESVQERCGTQIRSEGWVRWMGWGRNNARTPEGKNRVKSPVELKHPNSVPYSLSKKERNRFTLLTY